MNLNRRDLLAGIGGLAATAAFEKLGAQLPPDLGVLGGASVPGGPAEFPRKADFAIDEGYTYINAAYTHPIPKVSAAAARRAADGRGALRVPGAAPAGRGRASGPASAESNNPKALFAELINAKQSEIAYVSSTSAGENLVVSALGLDRKFEGNVVSDGLHYDGALLHLLELKKQGLDVRIAPTTKDFRIDMKDLERLVDKNTKLIEVSSAAMYNGFQHDLRAVSDLAHAHGAYVYADIIHSAGAEPFDVKATGIDFAACSSFKWLMGDFGLGFLYAKEEVLDKIKRPVTGYYQASRMEGFYPPFMPEGEQAPVSYTLNQTATGMFESGTLTGGPAVNVALIAASLNYIKGLGVANIQAHRLPLIEKLQKEVPRFGFVPVTPHGSTGGNVTFALKDVGTSAFPKKLQAAKVNVRFSRNWMRLSPSVYNDLADIDRFLEALG